MVNAPATCLEWDSFDQMVLARRSIIGPCAIPPKYHGMEKMDIIVCDRRYVKVESETPGFDPDDTPTEQTWLQDAVDLLADYGTSISLFDLACISCRLSDGIAHYLM